MSKFDELVAGYGLERVPPELIRLLVCCYPPCVSGDFKNKVLWTDKSVRYGNTMASYEAMIERIRNNCYCRMHVLRHFGDEEK